MAFTQKKDGTFVNDPKGKLKIPTGQINWSWIINPTKPKKKYAPWRPPKAKAKKQSGAK